MKLRAPLGVVCLVLAVGCGSKGSSPKKLSDDDTKSIEPASLGDLVSFASHVEGLVAAGDIAGLEGLWLLPEHLDGCEVDGKDISKDVMTSFPEKQIQKLRTDAAKEMAEDRLGTVLHTNSWKNQDANYLGGILKGEGCKAARFGRVNVVVKPKKNPPAVIEHRFNAQLIGDEWRLYRYMPTKPNCSTDKGGKSIGCRKLAGE